MRRRELLIVLLLIIGMLLAIALLTPDHSEEIRRQVRQETENKRNDLNRCLTLVPDDYSACLEAGGYSLYTPEP